MAIKQKNEVILGREYYFNISKICDDLDAENIQYNITSAFGHTTFIFDNCEDLIAFKLKVI